VVVTAHIRDRVIVDDVQRPRYDKLASILAQGVHTPGRDHTERLPRAGSARILVPRGEFAVVIRAEGSTHPRDQAAVVDGECIDLASHEPVAERTPRLAVPSRTP